MGDNAGDEADGRRLQNLRFVQAEGSGGGSGFEVQEAFSA